MRIVDEAECLTATDDDPCSSSAKEADCNQAGCCYNRILNQCMPSLFPSSGPLLK